MARLVNSANITSLISSRVMDGVEILPHRCVLQYDAELIYMLP